jgi:hypothetical protein
LKAGCGPAATPAAATANRAEVNMQGRKIMASIVVVHIYGRPPPEAFFR